MNNLTLLLIVAFTSICCQKASKSNYPEYYRNYNKILLLESEGKTQKAFELFQVNEHLVDFIPVNHLLKARNLSASLGNCAAVLDYFQKAVHNGFEYEEANFEDAQCPEINNASVVGIEFDEAYRSSIVSMFQKEQAARKGTLDVETEVVDAQNIATLLSLIEEKGFPSSKIVGRRASGNAFFIMLHFDADIGNKQLKPILDQAYHKGMIEPAALAWIEDRRRYWGPKKTDPYYYQLPSDKYFEMTPEEIAVIDKRRDSIGLKSLAEMNITRNENGSISIQY